MLDAPSSGVGKRDLESDNAVSGFRGQLNIATGCFWAVVKLVPASTLDIIVPVSWPAHSVFVRHGAVIALLCLSNS